MITSAPLVPQHGKQALAVLPNAGGLIKYFSNQQSFNKKMFPVFEMGSGGGRGGKESNKHQVPEHSLTPN